MIRSAILSSCGVYRYALHRSWAPDKGRACFILHNPSTADADNDDPTTTAGMAFADAWGYGALEYVNLSPYRATQPGVLHSLPTAALLGKNATCTCNHDSPQVYHCTFAIGTAAIVVAAWGNLHKSLWPARDAMLGFAALAGVQLWCLGTNKDGSPKHPLYVRRGTPLVKWPVLVLA